MPSKAVLKPGRWATWLSSSAFISNRSHPWISCSAIHSSSTWVLPCPGGWQEGRTMFAGREARLCFSRCNWRKASCSPLWHQEGVSSSRTNSRGKRATCGLDLHGFSYAGPCRSRPFRSGAAAGGAAVHALVAGSASYHKVPTGAAGRCVQLVDECTWF